MRGIGTTISGMMGRGSIRHNNREFTAANVDRNRSGQNIVFVNEDLKQVYHELFDEALESYNAGKKKTRDKIPDYYEHIRQSKQEKLFHEAIFQIGNLSDCGCGSEGGQRAAEALTEFAKTFQERNPHLRVFNMVLHMNEATPHLHVDYIPVATEQTRGLSVRVSMKQALKQQGFTGIGRKQTEWKTWMDREKDALTEIAQRHEFEIISLGSNRRQHGLAGVPGGDPGGRGRAGADGGSHTGTDRPAGAEDGTEEGNQVALRCFCGAEGCRTGAGGLRHHPTGKNAHRGCQGRYGGADQGSQGCGHVLNMLERHLPKQLLHLVDKARDLLPEHQS